MARLSLVAPEVPTRQSKRRKTTDCVVPCTSELAPASAVASVAATDQTTPERFALPQYELPKQRAWERRPRKQQSASSSRARPRTIWKRYELRNRPLVEQGAEQSPKKVLKKRCLRAHSSSTSPGKKSIVVKSVDRRKSKLPHKLPQNEDPSNVSIALSQHEASVPQPTASSSPENPLEAVQLDQDVAINIQYTDTMGNEKPVSPLQGPRAPHAPEFRQTLDDSISGQEGYSGSDMIDASDEYSDTFAQDSELIGVSSKAYIDDKAVSNDIGLDENLVAEIQHVVSKAQNVEEMPSESPQTDSLSELPVLDEKGYPNTSHPQEGTTAPGRVPTDKQNTDGWVHDDDHHGLTGLEHSHESGAEYIHQTSSPVIDEESEVFEEVAPLLDECITISIPDYSASQTGVPQGENSTVSSSAHSPLSGAGNGSPGAGSRRISVTRGEFSPKELLGSTDQHDGTAVQGTVEDDDEEISECEDCEDMSFQEEDMLSIAKNLREDTFQIIPSVSELMALKDNQHDELAQNSKTVQIPLHDDTDILKDFLNRSKAKKAEHIARQSSMSNRRDSDLVKLALASPRKPLEELDANSPGGHSNCASKAPSDKSSSAAMLDTPRTLKPILRLDEKDELAGNENNTPEASSLQPTRRSSRKPVNQGNSSESSIDLRGLFSANKANKSTSDAEELAKLTRNNTRRNKKDAISVPAMLIKLQTDPSADRSITAGVHEERGEDDFKIRWHEQLVNFYEKRASPVSETTKFSAPVSRARARRARALGAVNGTPAKVTMPTLALNEEEQEEQEAIEAPGVTTLNQETLTEDLSSRKPRAQRRIPVPTTPVKGMASTVRSKAKTPDKKNDGENLTASTSRHYSNGGSDRLGSARRVSSSVGQMGLLSLPAKVDLSAGRTLVHQKRS